VDYDTLLLPLSTSIELKHREGKGKVKQYSAMDTYCGSIDYVVFNSDKIHNLSRAVNERLLYRKVNGQWVTPHGPTKAALARLEATNKRDLYKHLTKTAKMTREEFLAGYSGRKLTVYTQAFDNLEHNPLGS